MSFSSTDSFDIDPLLDEDDDDFEINPFWSSDEDEGDIKNNVEDCGGFKTEKRDSGIELSAIKDDVLDGITPKEQNGAVDELAADVETIKLTKRNSSEGESKVVNKLYTIKDKNGRIVIEDDLSRAYSKQKSIENNKGMHQFIMKKTFLFDFNVSFVFI